MDPTSRPFIRWLKRLAIQTAIAVVVAAPVRACVITPFRVPGNSVEPEVKQGSHVLVYRLASEFQPGDIVAYRHEDNIFVARCENVTPTGMDGSRREARVAIPWKAIVGRVVVSTRSLGRAPEWLFRGHAI